MRIGSRKMKTILLILLTVVLPLGATEAFKFPFEGKVEIEETNYLLNGDKDGGSIHVTLRDAKGTLSFVHYMTKDAGAEFGGGLLSFKTNKAEKWPPRFPQGSDDEAQLLKILRSACIATFGSADPNVLDNPATKKGGIHRLVMASLLRHFPARVEQAAPTDGNKPSN